MSKNKYKKYKKRIKPCTDEYRLLSGDKKSDGLMLRLYEYANATTLGLIPYPEEEMRNEYIKKYGIRSYLELKSFTDDWHESIDSEKPELNNELGYK